MYGMHWALRKNVFRFSKFSSPTTAQGLPTMVHYSVKPTSSWLQGPEFLSHLEVTAREGWPALEGVPVLHSKQDPGVTGSLHSDTQNACS